MMAKKRVKDMKRERQKAVFASLKGSHSSRETSKRAARKNKDRWIQDAIKEEGALSRQLDIPEEKDIPITLLRKIKRTDIGDTIENPTETGRQRIKVTRKLKKRAVLAHNLKTM